MHHTVRVPTPPFVAMDGALEVHQVPAASDNLCWILVCTATGEAAVVDGPDAGPVLDYVLAHGLRLTTILNTHTHGDHVGINADFARRGTLGDYRVVGARQTREAIPGLTDPVEEGDEVRLGSVTGRVLLTEGHIDGHISFLFGDALFCGDTLFTGGCGYLFDGPPEKMFRSLLRLAELEGSTRVCCAHEYTQDNLRFAWSVEPDNDALAARIRRVWALRDAGGCAVPSTIAEERATNPFLRPGSPSLVQRVGEAMNTVLASPLEVFTETRRLKDRKDHRAIPDGALPLEVDPAS